MRSQFNAYSKSLFHCNKRKVFRKPSKSGSAKAGSCHQNTLTTGVIIETAISFDDLTSSKFNPAFCRTGCQFVIIVVSNVLLIGFGKRNVRTLCTRFKDRKCDSLYSIVTSPVKRDIPVSLTGSVQRVFHIYPKNFNQAMHVNIVGRFIGEIGS